MVIDPSVHSQSCKALPETRRPDAVGRTPLREQRAVKYGNYFLKILCLEGSVSIIRGRTVFVFVLRADGINADVKEENSMHVFFCS